MTTLPKTFECRYAGSHDALTVKPADEDGDIPVSFQYAGESTGTIYLTPSEARKLRKALKTAIAEAEDL